MHDAYTTDKVWSVGYDMWFEQYHTLYTSRPKIDILKDGVKDALRECGYRLGDTATPTVLASGSFGVKVNGRVVSCEARLFLKVQRAGRVVVSKDFHRELEAIRNGSSSEWWFNVDEAAEICSIVSPLLSDTVSLCIEESFNDHQVRGAIEGRQFAPDQIRLRRPQADHPTGLSPEDVFNETFEAVVSITGSNHGSGFYIAPGLILTNQHVVEGDEVAEVTFYSYLNGEVVPSFTTTGDVVAIDPDDDLAAIRLQRVPRGVEPLTLAEQTPITGSRVFAIGCPTTRALANTLVLTEGIISRFNVTLEKMECHQHTAAVNFGNSGGPLLNDSGFVIGMNAISDRELQATNYAITADRMRRFMRAKLR